MKKKIRSRSNSKFPVAFLIVVFLCLCGATWNFYKFYESFNSTLSKLNEEPIATISFKYKTAQRKFAERMAWDRLQQDSPLYNGDTIHTADMAEATIKFTDGNRIELYESTMVQIWASDDKTVGKKASIMSGSIAADLENEDGSALTIEAPTISDLGIKVGAGSSVNVGVDNGGYVQAVIGSATLVSNDGTEKAISEGETVEVAKDEVKIPQITVSSPSPNQKILYHTDGRGKVDFKWKTSNINQGTNVYLEIAQDKAYENIVKSTAINTLPSLQVNLDPGTYYWRIKTVNVYSDDAQVTVGSKIQVIRALPPSLVAPVEGYEYHYRTKNPAVRLIWTESNQAASYNLVISKSSHLDNPVLTQRTSTTSSIVSTLDAGTYYWQVTPYFTINREGFNAASEVHTFTVNQDGSLASPILLAPSQSSIVNIENNADNTFFSWKQESEAVKYNVEFSKNDAFSGSKKKFETQDNYISLKGKNNFDEGQWYWRVTQTDVEGNVSESSSIGTFYALKGKPDQRTIEPIDGYKVSSTLVQDLKFTWKKNLPSFYNSRMEISSSEDFSTIVYSDSASGYSLNGVNLPIGKYWWRLVSDSDNAEAPELVTPAKHLDVVTNLPKAVLKAPLNRAVAREATPFEYKWEDVEDADYYKLTVYKADTDEVVYDDVIYSSSFTLDMYNNEKFVDKAYYRWELQAKANAIPGICSRRNGEVAEGNFQLFKLRPVEIVTPKKNAVLKGVDTALDDIEVSWKVVDAVKEAQVVVTRIGENGEEDKVIKIPSDEEFQNGKVIAPNTVKFVNPDLTNGGNYQVVVKAKTLDDIDISNTDSKYVGKFSITPVTPLAATGSVTVQPQEFNTEYLTNKDNPRTISLSWIGVPTATDYVVEILNSKNKVLVHQEITKGTKCEVNWLELIEKAETAAERKALYSGTFTWTIEAIRKIDADKDGIKEKVLQQGVKKQGTFKTDVKMPKSASGKGAKNPYGN